MQFVETIKNSSRNEIGIQAKLECIHADEKGYVFYLNHYERPSWNTGDNTCR